VDLVKRTIAAGIGWESAVFRNQKNTKKKNRTGNRNVVGGHARSTTARAKNKNIKKVVDAFVHFQQTRGFSLLSPLF